MTRNMTEATPLPDPTKQRLAAVKGLMTRVNEAVTEMGAPTGVVSQVKITLFKTESKPAVLKKLVNLYQERGWKLEYGDDPTDVKSRLLVISKDTQPMVKPQQDIQPFDAPETALVPTEKLGVGDAFKSVGAAYVDGAKEAAAIESGVALMEMARQGVMTFLPDGWSEAMMAEGTIPALASEVATPGVLLIALEICGPTTPFYEPLKQKCLQAIKGQNREKIAEARKMLLPMVTNLGQMALSAGMSSMPAMAAPKVEPAGKANGTGSVVSAQFATQGE